MCAVAADEVIMHEGFIAVYKSNVDLYFYVLGAPTENEVSCWCCWCCCQLLLSSAAAAGGTQCSV